MSLRIVVASLTLLGMLLMPLAASGDRVPGRQSAIVRFEGPTWVAGQLLAGTYVIVHDESKMARGEPCTALYLMRTGTYPLEEAVSFRCTPVERTVVRRFTSTIRSDWALGTGTFDTLTEFQFAGDSEGHGVPNGAPMLVSGELSLPLPETVVCPR
jgi:hypothetical protein